MSRRDDLREIDRSLNRITRIGRGRAAARLRSERSGVELSRAGVAILAALVTREMRLLTAQGFVRSQPDPSDGRARIVDITPAGKTAFTRYRDAIDEIIADTFSAWNAGDLATLRRLLRRVADDFAHPDPTS